MKTLKLLPTLLLIASCTSIPGNVKTVKSDFDGSTYHASHGGYVKMSSALSPGLRLGFRWVDKSPDIMIFEIYYPALVNFVESDGLLFNIDGKITSLSSPTMAASHEVTFTTNLAWQKSKRAYVGTVDLARRIASAKLVKIKAITYTGAIEGQLAEVGGSMSAIRELKEVLKRVDETK